MALIHTPWSLKRAAEFYRELAALFNAGVPVLQALQHIRKHPPSAAYRPRLFHAEQRIRNGATLTEAFAASRGWLPDFDLALIRAGEESGRLTQCCQILTRHYTERAQLIEGFITKLLYPVFLFHFAILIFPPNLLAQLLLHGEVIAFLIQKLSVLIPLWGTIFVLTFLLQSDRHGPWQSFLESFFRAIPGLGSARREMALARLAASLEALISAGVNTIEAWELAANASGSPALRRTVHQWRPLLEAGDTPSDLLQRSRAFPDLFTNLYSTGELSGQLDGELKHLHQYYQDSGTQKLGRFSLILALIIMLSIMGLIAFWVVRFWANYYNQLFDNLGI